MTRDPYVYKSYDRPSPPEGREGGSIGKLNSPTLVSIPMPRKVIFVEGPSHLWAASGIPSSVHLLRSFSKARGHSSEPGAPSTTKSSR